ncbi:MAG TPA: hypothetical protein PKW90_24950, partial [Myxococcota bacterium]|nr:hypothetical protein [Myxococcota bacterium]
MQVLFQAQLLHVVAHFAGNGTNDLGFRPVAGVQNGPQGLTRLHADGLAFVQLPQDAAAQAAEAAGFFLFFVVVAVWHGHLVAPPATFV